jgi:hypothetical protein
MTTRPPLPRQRHDGSIHWTSRSILALAQWEHDALGAAIETMPALLEKITDWTPSAIPSSSQGERVNGGQYDEGGNKNGPVPTFVIRKDTTSSPDRITGDMVILIQALMRMQQTVDTVNRMMSRLTVIDAETAQAIFTLAPDRPGAGQCGNPACGHTCTGERDDRLIKARCRRCYDYRLKYGNERPHDDCHPDTLGGCNLCTHRAARAATVTERATA